MRRIEKIAGVIVVATIMAGCPSYRYAYERQLRAVHETKCLVNEADAPKSPAGVVFVVRAKGMAIHVNDFRMKKLRWVFDVTGIPATARELRVLQLFAVEMNRGKHGGARRVDLNRTLKEIRRKRIVCFGDSVNLAPYMSVLRAAKFPRYAKKSIPLAERQSLYVQRVKNVRSSGITFVVRGVPVVKLTYLGIRRAFDLAGVPASLLETIRLDKLISLIAQKAEQYSGRRIDLYPALLQMRKQRLDTRLRRDLGRVHGPLKAPNRGDI